MHKYFTIIFLVSFILIPSFGDLKAQAESEEETETFMTDEDLELEEKAKLRHSPKKAALLALACPGLGHIYNKKYWKLPIVYGALGGMGFWVGTNIKNLNGYTNALKAQLGDPPDNTASYNDVSDVTQLRSRRDQFKNSMDLSIILTIVVYAIHVGDAVVDAHLFEYDVNEDITVALKPSVSTLSAFNQSFAPNAGLSFVVNFKEKQRFQATKNLNDF
jgi:hypothetical protein